MNWIERMYEIKGKDPYSQNGEGILLEYVWICISIRYGFPVKQIFDIGSGDGFILNNSRWLTNTCGFNAYLKDKILGHEVNLQNCTNMRGDISIISIDIDGNDYWILDKQLPHYKPYIVCAEFNPAFTDSRTIKYNPSHEWAGDDYYGFSFEAGKKLAEKHGYEIIFNVANMNLIMVWKDLINVSVPLVTYKQDNFFKSSGRPDSDWVWI